MSQVAELSGHYFLLMFYMCVCVNVCLCLKICPTAALASKVSHLQNLILEFPSLAQIFYPINSKGDRQWRGVLNFEPLKFHEYALPFISLLIRLF